MATDKEDAYTKYSSVGEGLKFMPFFRKTGITNKTVTGFCKEGGLKGVSAYGFSFS